MASMDKIFREANASQLIVVRGWCGLKKQGKTKILVIEPLNII